jgi:hypothetical protein
MEGFHVWEMQEDGAPQEERRYLAGKTYKNHLGHLSLEVWGTGLSPELAVADANGRGGDTGFRCFIKDNTAPKLSG